ncbi:MAG TPA: hypothetical protein VFJ43_02195 [Bacteroidia bacterium]|nr:hypothetical protein [Bacteroidia bacterium]
MYHHSLFTQVLSNPALKSVEIVLLGGNISIKTHPGDEVYVSGENMKDENLMPFLHETEETIRIDRHSLFNLIFLRENVNLVIFIPANCDLMVLLRGGNLKLSGNFGQVRVRTDAGNITADLNNFSVKGQADLTVFAGEIKLVNSNPVDKKDKRKKSVDMKIGEARLKAKVSLGDIWLTEMAR